MADTPYRPLDKESNYVNSWSRLDNNTVARNVTIMGADGTHITATGGKLDVNASVTISGISTEEKQDEQITLTKNAQDMFGSQVIGQRYNQFEVAYNNIDPDNISGITITKTNGGDAATANGQAVFSTSTNANGEIKVITNTNIDYQPHFEVYVAFSAIFTTGVANSYQRIGIYDDNNGFFIGYEGTSFGITKRTGGVDTTVAKASFNLDTLTGASTSKFTRGGTPEAIDLTKDNLYRIRYGWLGAAPILFEVFSPDGIWVAFHIVRHPNSSTVPTLTSTALPMRLHIKKTSANATNLIINTACWAAGATTDLQKLNYAISDNSLVKPVRSILAAKKPNGTYTNIDATAGGNLKVSIEEVDGGADIATETTLDAINTKLVSGTDIGDVTVNNGSGASAVNIQDGGNSITVDGTVSASQSGTWNINNVSGTVSLPTGASTSANQATANTLLGGIAGFTPAVYDYISLTYTGSDLTGVVFKTGGSGGTTVSTLTLAYSGSNLISVTKT